jgi:hypothetical protein
MNPDFAEKARELVREIRNECYDEIELAAALQETWNDAIEAAARESDTTEVYSCPEGYDAGDVKEVLRETAADIRALKVQP